MKLNKKEQKFILDELSKFKLELQSNLKLLVKQYNDYNINLPEPTINDSDEYYMAYKYYKNFILPALKEEIEAYDEYISKMLNSRAEYLLKQIEFDRLLKYSISEGTLELPSNIVRWINESK